MRMIYIVEGSTGEYSDNRTWPIAAYESEESAKSHVAAADVWARANGVHGDLETIRYYYDSREQLANPFDSGMTVDYTGVWYCYYGVEFRESFELPQSVDAVDPAEGRVTD